MSACRPLELKEIKHTPQHVHIIDKQAYINTCTVHTCTVYTCTVHTCTVHTCTVHTCTVHTVCIK